MPTFADIDGFRFFFYSLDCAEPPHAHVEKGGAAAKYWLSPIRRSGQKGFKRQELRAIERILKEKQNEFLAKWKTHCAQSTP